MGIVRPVDAGESASRFSTPQVRKTQSVCGGKHVALTEVKTFVPRIDLDQGVAKMTRVQSKTHSMTQCTCSFVCNSVESPRCAFCESLNSNASCGIQSDDVVIVSPPEPFLADSQRSRSGSLFPYSEDSSRGMSGLAQPTSKDKENLSEDAIDECALSSGPNPVDKFDGRGKVERFKSKFPTLFVGKSGESGHTGSRALPSCLNVPVLGSKSRTDPFGFTSGHKTPPGLADVRDSVGEETNSSSLASKGRIKGAPKNILAGDAFGRVPDRRAKQLDRVRVGTAGPFPREVNVGDEVEILADFHVGHNPSVMANSMEISQRDLPPDQCLLAGEVSRSSLTTSGTPPAMSIGVRVAALPVSAVLGESIVHSPGTPPAMNVGKRVEVFPATEISSVLNVCILNVNSASSGTALPVTSASAGRVRSAKRVSSGTALPGLCGAAGRVTRGIAVSDTDVTAGSRLCSPASPRGKQTSILEHLASFSPLTAPDAPWISAEKAAEDHPEIRRVRPGDPDSWRGSPSELRGTSGGTSFGVCKQSTTGSSDEEDGGCAFKFKLSESFSSLSEDTDGPAGSRLMRKQLLKKSDRFLAFDVGGREVAVHPRASDDGNRTSTGVHVTPKQPTPIARRTRGQLGLNRVPLSPVVVIQEEAIQILPATPEGPWPESQSRDLKTSRGEVSQLLRGMRDSKTSPVSIDGEWRVDVIRWSGTDNHCGPVRDVTAVLQEHGKTGECHSDEVKPGLENVRKPKTMRRNPRGTRRPRSCHNVIPGPETRDKKGGEKIRNTGGPPAGYLCEFCDKPFKSAKARGRHVKVIHGLSPSSPPESAGESEDGALKKMEFEEVCPTFKPSFRNILGEIDMDQGKAGTTRMTVDEHSEPEGLEISGNLSSTPRDPPSRISHGKQGNDEGAGADGVCQEIAISFNLSDEEREEILAGSELPTPCPNNVASGREKSLHRDEISLLDLTAKKSIGGPPPISPFSCKSTGEQKRTGGKIEFTARTDKRGSGNVVPRESLAPPGRKLTDSPRDAGEVRSTDCQDQGVKRTRKRGKRRPRRGAGVEESHPLQEGEGDRVRKSSGPADREQVSSSFQPEERGDRQPSHHAQDDEVLRIFASQGELETNPRDETGSHDQIQGNPSMHEPPDSLPPELAGKGADEKSKHVGEGVQNKTSLKPKPTGGNILPGFSGESSVPDKETTVQVKASRRVCWKDRLSKLEGTGGNVQEDSPDPFSQNTDVQTKPRILQGKSHVISTSSQFENIEVIESGGVQVNIPLGVTEGRKSFAQATEEILEQERRLSDFAPPLRRKVGTPVLRKQPAKKYAPESSPEDPQRPEASEDRRQDPPFTPMEPLRMGGILHISFPARNSYPCTEEGCRVTPFHCSSWMACRRSLIRHLLQAHGIEIKETRKWCKLCSMRTTSRVSSHPCLADGNLMEADTDTTRRFKCVRCGFSSDSKRGIQNHRASHTKVDRTKNVLLPQKKGFGNSRAREILTRAQERARRDPVWRKNNNVPSNRFAALPVDEEEVDDAPADVGTAASNQVGCSPDTANNKRSPRGSPSAQNNRRIVFTNHPVNRRTVIPAGPPDDGGMIVHTGPQSSNRSVVLASPTEEDSQSCHDSQGSIIIDQLDEAGQAEEMLDPSPEQDTVPSPEVEGFFPLQPFRETLHEIQRNIQEPGSWDEFENVMQEITTSISTAAHLPPRSQSGGTFVPQPVDAGNCKIIQKLYNRNRRRAVRLIVEGESRRCNLNTDIVEEHFTRTFQERDFEEEVLDGTFPTGHPVIDTTPFSPLEVKQRLSKFENSAPGPDRITYEHLRRVDPDALILARILNICLSSGKIPKAWRHSRSILIYKKGDVGDIANWRPISLCCSLYKLYTGCLASRLSNWLVSNEILSPAQKGFMPFDGVFEHRFVMEQAISTARMQKTPLCIAQIDLTNAFGSISHKAILAALQRAGAGEAFIKAVEGLYTETSTEFIAGDGVSDCLQINAGVRQGCPISGILFNIVIDPIIRKMQGDEADHRVLAFADDISLIGYSPEELQGKLDLLAALTVQLNLHVNPTKCMTMHYSGETPSGTRPTTFRIAGTNIHHLSDGEESAFLGSPIGFQLSTPLEDLSDIMELGKRIASSRLAPWQRIDALKTFFYPALVFAMRVAKFNKGDYRLIDELIRPLIKETLYLETDAANQYIYGATEDGLFGVPNLAEESDVVLVDSAFKLLTSRDEKIREMAWADLLLHATTRTGLEATPELVEQFLSGNNELREFRTTTNPLASTWSHARAASTRLGLQWRCRELLEIEIIADEEVITAAKRTSICQKLKARLRKAWSQELIRMPSQGKTIELTSRHKASGHFLRSGTFTKFADWRFIHSARLNLLRLNANKPWDDTSRGCRRCNRGEETLQHVLSSCLPAMAMRTKRHNAIVARISKGLSRGWKIYGQDQRVSTSRLRPDLVIHKGDSAMILDVIVPYENRVQAFVRARAEKEQKYQEIATDLRQRFREVSVDAVVVGSLGAWDPKNDPILRRCINKRYLRKLSKLCVSDTITHSRMIFQRHVFGHIPPEIRQQENPANQQNLIRAATNHADPAVSCAINEPVASLNIAISDIRHTGGLTAPRPVEVSSITSTNAGPRSHSETTNNQIIGTELCATKDNLPCVSGK